MIVILHTSKELYCGIFMKNSMYLSWMLRKLLLQSNSKEGLKKQKKKKKCFWQECQSSPDSWMIFIFQHQKFIPCSSRKIFKLLNTQYSKYSIFKSLNASLHTLLSFFSLNTFLSIFFFTFFTFLFYVFTHHKFTKVLKTPEKLISSSKISSFSSSEFLP